MIKIDTIQSRPKWATALKIILRILTALILVIVMPLIIINVSFMFQADKAIPSFMGYSMLNVVSGSMSGTIEVGDMVVIKETQDIQVGDIVTYITKDNSVITHRVINIEQKEGQTLYTTKGDANNVADPNKETIDQIQGKEIFNLGGFGNISAFLQKPQGLIILVGVPIILISITKFYEVRFANKRVMRKKQRLEYIEENKGV